MDSFLVIQTAFLGDVILATPVISELKRLYPNSKIDVVVRKDAKSLIENHKDVSEVIVFDKSKGKFKALKEVLSKTRLKEYDEIINLQRYFSSGVISMFSKGKRKIGFNKNPLSLHYNKKFKHQIGDGTHEVERNLKLIAHHGAEKKVKPSLYPSDADIEKTIKYKSKDYYCLAPASIWETKQLPVRKWIELGNKLLDTGVVYLIGGPNDEKLCSEINKALDNKAINLAGKLTLMQSAALIKDAKRSFVNDSAPLHISSAMNTPTTAYFCSTIPSFGFGPLADDSNIVESIKALECRPCGIHGKKECPLKHFECGHSITIN